MENVAYADREIGEISEISEIKANYKYPKLGNSTKVVRIFVVGLNGRTLDQIVAEESPTRADVFVELPSDGTLVLEPKTWLGGPGLVDHDEAHDKHRGGTIPILKGKSRDQIEWQCDVSFQVRDITLVDKDEDMHGFHNYKGQEEPFEKLKADLKAVMGGPSKPIRSGPTKIVWVDPPIFKPFPLGWKQLYKAHFTLTINGDEMLLDPDFYCEWH